MQASVSDGVNSTDELTKKVLFDKVAILAEMAAVQGLIANCTAADMGLDKRACMLSNQGPARFFKAVCASVPCGVQMEAVFNDTEVRM